MTESALKALVAQKTFSQKVRSPYARDLDRVIPLNVEKFEQIGDQVAAVGIDLRTVKADPETGEIDLSTGETVRVFKSWASSSEKRNPLIAAAERVQPGGIMLFTETSKIRVKGFEDAWSAEDFVTVVNDSDENTSLLSVNDPAFVDTIETNDKGKEYQVYNIIQTRSSRAVASGKEFFSAMAEAFKNREYADDSIIIRGYSEQDKMASSIRVQIEKGTRFEDAMKSILEQTLPIDIVGEAEGTHFVNGKDLVSSIGGPETGTVWEIIPVWGIRKNLSPQDQKLAAKLKANAATMVAEFTYKGESEQCGYRSSIIGIKEVSLHGGRQAYDIVRAFHEFQPARPLAIVNTHIHPEIETEFVDYKKPTVEVAPASAEPEDFSSYIEKLAEEIEFDNFDLLSDENSLVEAADDSFEVDPSVTSILPVDKAETLVELATEEAPAEPEISTQEVQEGVIETAANENTVEAETAEESVSFDLDAFITENPETLDEAVQEEVTEAVEAEVTPNEPESALDIDLDIFLNNNPETLDEILQDEPVDTPAVQEQLESQDFGFDLDAFVTSNPETLDAVLADEDVAPIPEQAPAIEAKTETKGSVEEKPAPQKQSEPKDKLEVTPVPMVAKEKDIDFLSSIKVADEVKPQEQPTSEGNVDQDEVSDIFTTLGLGA